MGFRRFFYRLACRVPDALGFKVPVLQVYESPRGFRLHGAWSPFTKPPNRGTDGSLAGETAADRRLSP